MATINQIQKGFAQFVDGHIAGAFEGWQKAVVVGSATLLAANFPNMVKVYGSHPLVAALGVYDAASGNINIDALHKAFTTKLGTEKIPVSIPKLGTIRLGKEELDTLARYIKEA
jgi:hypothetical protein